MKVRMVAWLAAMLLLACTAWAEENPSPGQAAGAVATAEAGPSVADYNGKRIGIITGPLMEEVAREFFPDSEHLLFNSYPDCITALVSGRIDGV